MGKNTKLKRTDPLKVNVSHVQEPSIDLNDV